MPLPLPPYGLYAVTPDPDEPDTLRDRITAVLTHGAAVIQLRDKHHRLDRTDARHLLELCHRHGVPMIVNDDVELALHIGADGVHLGREDMPLEAARARLGKDRIVGISCYADPDRAEVAWRAGASYVAFGAFFASGSKPEAPPAPVEVLTEARRRIGCPIVAIGGITPENGGQLVNAGADLLAVIGGLFATPDPQSAARRYRRLFSRKELSKAAPSPPTCQSFSS